MCISFTTVAVVTPETILKTIKTQNLAKVFTPTVLFCCYAIRRPIDVILSLVKMFSFPTASRLSKIL